MYDSGTYLTVLNGLHYIYKETWFMASNNKYLNLTLNPYTKGFLAYQALISYLNYKHFLPNLKS